MMELPNTRGFRNCNPGNIRHSDSKWIGMKSEQNDKSFVQFTSMSYGVRALVKLLRNYYNYYNLPTVGKIISRFAPSDENNTEVYINYICSNTGFSSSSHLADPATETGRRAFADLCAAIIAFENGTTVCNSYFYGLAYYWLFIFS